MKEIWKDIEGYEGLYQASNLGRVRSLSHDVLCKDGSVKHFCGKVLSFVQTRGGYLSIFLCKDGCPKSYRVNRVVAKLFVPNPHNKPHVDHIDGCRTNNCATNLRWVTHTENMNNPNTKYKKAKTVFQIKDGVVINIYKSAVDARRATGIIHVQSVCAGDRRSAGGYVWKYK